MISPTVWARMCTLVQHAEADQVLFYVQAVMEVENVKSVAEAERNKATRRKEV